MTPIKLIKTEIPEANKEVVEYLKMLLKMAHKHEVLWLEIDGVILRPSGDQYMEYSWPPLDFSGGVNT